MPSDSPKHQSIDWHALAKQTFIRLPVILIVEKPKNDWCGGFLELPGFAAGASSHRIVVNDMLRLLPSIVEECFKFPKVWKPDQEDHKHLERCDIHFPSLNDLYTSQESFKSASAVHTVIAMRDGEKWEVPYFIFNYETV